MVMLVVLAILVLLGLFVWAEKNRRQAAHELEATQKQLEELKKSTSGSGDAVAKEVLDKVSHLINIPIDPRPTVAKINDIEKLREANSFFNAAKNGDYLILTGSRAILYNPDKNIVIDVAPFKVNSESPTPSGSPTKGKPTATPTPSASPVPTQ